MATPRDRAYSQFNFLVSWDDLDPESVKAGFQEVSGLGLEINIAEYRGGNFKENGSQKITGSWKVPDITLKRGVIGELDLLQWIEEVRNGSQTALKTVVIELLSEDRSATAMKWTLSEARPIKYTGPSLNGKGTDVAMEELVLATERITME